MQRETNDWDYATRVQAISILSLYAEGDLSVLGEGSELYKISILSLYAEGDAILRRWKKGLHPFQSSPSMQRETILLY